MGLLLLVLLSPRKTRNHSLRGFLAYLEMLCTALGSSGIWVSRAADDRNRTV